MKAIDIPEFDDLLAQALSNASSEWEIGFVTDVESRYLQYGDNTFISERQEEVLRRIANWD